MKNLLIFPLKNWKVYFLLLLSPILAVQAQEDCILTAEEIKPLIEAFNPLFSEHLWDNERKVESAKLDNRYLINIRQHGCERHHKEFILYPYETIPENADSFWVASARSVFRALYYGKREYEIFGEEFEELLEERLVSAGANKEFNFPLDSRNFFCEVIWREGERPRLRIEMVEFLFREKIGQNRLPDKKDDAYYIKSEK